MSVERLIQEDLNYRSFKYLKQFDFQKVLEATEQVLSIADFQEDNGQLGLTHRIGCNDRFYDAVGYAIHPEEEFVHFVDEFKHTYFYEIYTFLQRRFGFKIGRVRLNKIPAKKCFSWHRDSEPRIHIPIKTCYGAFFLFDDETYKHFPADGGAWLVDTTRFHTAINTSSQDRIHLLVDVYGKN